MVVGGVVWFWRAGPAPHPSGRAVEVAGMREIDISMSISFAAHPAPWTLIGQECLQFSSIRTFSCVRA